MSNFRRVIGFGDALLLDARAVGGLNPAVGRIHSVVGETIGSRPTFAKLLDMVDPPTRKQDRERAWLLLTAIGQDPADWELGDFKPPSSWDTEALRDLARGDACLPSHA